MRYVRKEISYSPKKGIMNSLKEESRGVYHQVMSATHMHHLFDMAEHIRNVAAFEERDQLWYRIDCVNRLGGEGVVFDLSQCSKKWGIFIELKKMGEEVQPWGNVANRINGRDKFSIFNKALKKAYGIDRFRSMIMIHDGHWNGRGTLVRI